MHGHSQERQRCHSKRCPGNHRCPQQFFWQPQLLTRSCIPSHHSQRASLSAPSTVWCLSGQQTLLEDPVSHISFQGFSSLQGSQPGLLAQQTHSRVCLFLIPVEALTQGNLWGSANDVRDGPQQGVMDCPLGSAQLNQALPSPCQPG